MDPRKQEMANSVKNTKKKLKVGILGYGEVGRAIAKFYQNPRFRKRFGGQAKIKDLNRDDGLKGVEILHICIPWGDNFIKIVRKEIKKIKPKLTVIHSTIAPGTTKKLALSLPKEISGMVVHSPIRGIHPYLYQGIKTFVKYIGTDSKRAGELAKKHLEDLGIKTKVFIPSVTTEIGKLLDTFYYGLCIAGHGEMKKICDKEGVDFEKAVTDFNETYNKGYTKLNKPNVIRPVLYPPREGFGGHCVLENTVLLRESIPQISLATDFILGVGKDQKSIREEKPYLNKTWLYTEYWGKGRSTEDIGKQFGVTGENISAVMKRRGIPIRDRKWTKQQLDMIKRLAEKGETFKAIAQELESAGKTYNAIRNTAYKVLKIKSAYNPAIRDEETRRKISASLQGISEEDWDGFKETINALIRKSVSYQNWRESVWKRDRYTCQKCGARSGQGRAVYLVVHHIKSFGRNSDLRINTSNGITLCRKDHLEFHKRYGFGNNTKKQLREFLSLQI